MANDALIESVKSIMARAKEAGADAGYEGYRELFASEAFAGYRVEDQRQALKLMVLAKSPTPSPVMVEAHRVALGLLTNMVATHADAADHELLGICHLVLGDEAAASAVFRAGLAIVRATDPQSKLCGTLMKRVAAL